MQTIIEIENAVARLPEKRMDVPFSLCVEEGETLALCGPNGGGKSLASDLITGASPLAGGTVEYRFPRHGGNGKYCVRTISFRDVYGTSAPAYYQQRWNRWDDMPFPTVGEILSSLSDEDMYRRLGIDKLRDKSINLLSSGELRRVQICRVMTENPDLLVIDNPYIGLDMAARETFTSLLEVLARHLTLVLVVSRADHIPSFVDKVVHVENKRAENPVSREEYMRRYAANVRSVPEMSLPSEKKAVPRNEGPDSMIIDMDDVTVAYGNHTLLSHLDWHVRRGERWALTGENGAGKSTLLSLVCADNPMAYACPVRLFGNRRGQGESIWDIKKRIGYVSPEMFSTYCKNLPAIDIVASGLHDTIGLYRKCRPEEEELCMAWMETFGAAHLARCNYLQLSSGEQRLTLLVRAFVKSPELLVLDEPFHGLDDMNASRAREVINRYMESPDRTLIMVTHYKDELPSCINRHLHLTKPQ